MNWLKFKFRWLVFVVRTWLLTEALKKGRANMDMVLGVLRALLAAAGGWLIQKGYSDAGQVDALIGAILVIAAGIWSIVQKVRAKPVQLRPAK